MNDAAGVVADHHGFRGAIEHGVGTLLAEECCFHRGMLFHEGVYGAAQAGLLHLRFQQVVSCSTVDSIPGKVLISRATEDQKRQVAGGSEELLKNFQAAADGRVDIQDDGVNGTGAKVLKGVGYFAGAK